jgi:hypothetical protein
MQSYQSFYVGWLEKDEHDPDPYEYEDAIRYSIGDTIFWFSYIHALGHPFGLFGIQFGSPPLEIA